MSAEQACIGCTAQQNSTMNASTQPPRAHADGQIGACGWAALGGTVCHRQHSMCAAASQGSEGRSVDGEVCCVAGRAHVCHLDHCRRVASGDGHAQTAAGERGALRLFTGVGWAGTGEQHAHLPGERPLQRWWRSGGGWSHPWAGPASTDPGLPTDQPPPQCRATARLCGQARIAGERCLPRPACGLVQAGPR